MREPVTVIGAGLAGCEAAWQLAQAGIPVVLREMKPRKKTPAHHADLFGELVCSNSLRSDQLENACLLYTSWRTWSRVRAESTRRAGMPVASTRSSADCSPLACSARSRAAWSSVRASGSLPRSTTRRAGASSFCWGGAGGGLSRPSSRARAAPGAKGVFGCSLSG